MRHSKLALLIIVLASTQALTACAQATDGGTVAATPAALVGQVAPDTGKQRRAQSAWPVMVVSKSASCGCCQLWVDHMHDAGFAVEVVNTDGMGTIKQRVGVPYGKGSCHTAEVGGYFIEGHVPADDIKRLLTERPRGKGLVVPGMPAGSPGMELPDGRVQPYVVELVADDGSTSEFARHAD